MRIKVILRGKILQNNLYKKITALLLIILIFNSTVYFNLRENRFVKNYHITNAQTLSIYHDSRKIQEVADKIIAWTKKYLDITPSDSLIEKGLSGIAGSSYSDWYVVGVRRISSSEKTPEYIRQLSLAIKNIMNKTNIVGSDVTDMFRDILTLSVLGENPSNFKIPDTNQYANLISEYVYNRKKFAPPSTQLINWLTWSLIVLDSKQYQVPSNATFTREKLIVEILKQQKTAGGFALSPTSKASDPDISAMVIQALAPYNNSEKTYSFTRTIDKLPMVKTVRQVIDESLASLSKTQLPSGDYEARWSSVRSRNVETVAQLALALCCLGIDPQKDERFIKNGKSLIDGILLYQNTDGGFSHEYPKSASNNMTSSQVLYTFAAILRQQKSMRTLYDFRDEQSTALKNKIYTLKQKISQITDKTAKYQLDSLLNEYNSIVDNERMYVYNYPVLEVAIKKKNSGVSLSESVVSSSDSSLILASSSNDSSAQMSISDEDSENGNSSYVITGDESISGKVSNSVGTTSKDNGDLPKSKSKDFLKIAIIIIACLIGIVIAWSYFGTRKKGKQ